MQGALTPKPMDMPLSMARNMLCDAVNPYLQGVVVGGRERERMGGGGELGRERV